MRKLAREAVIFMLLTPLLFIVGGFAYLYHDAHKRVLFDMSKAQPVETVPVPPGAILDPPIPCKDGDKDIEQGRILWQCEKGIRAIDPIDYEALAKKSGGITSDDPFAPYGGQEIRSKPLDLSKFGGKVVPPKPAFDPNQPYTYVAPAPSDLSAGFVPKPRATSELLGESLLIGLYGFPAGFGFWVFYRVVRFAVKG